MVRYKVALKRSFFEKGASLVASVVDAIIVLYATWIFWQDAELGDL